MIGFRTQWTIFFFLLVALGIYRLVLNIKTTTLMLSSIKDIVDPEIVNGPIHQNVVSMTEITNAATSPEPVRTVNHQEDMTSNQSKLPADGDKDKELSTGQAPVQNTLNSTECRLDRQRQLHPLINQWLDEKVPMLMNVFVLDNVYYALFEFGHLGKEEERTKWKEVTWYCNEKTHPAEFLRGGVTLRCNVSTPLTTIWPSLVSPVTNSSHMYQVHPYFSHDCNDILAQELQQPSAPTATANIAACTSIRGDWPRQITHQWIEYHRLIGIQHFIVYLDESWHNISLLPQRPYVTYIPYDFSMDNHPGHRPPKGSFKWYNFFQISQQNDCLFLTKRLSQIHWVAMTDVDEFIYIADPNGTMTAQHQPQNKTDSPLNALLTKLSKEHEDDIGGIELNSFSFGSNTKTSNHSRYNQSHYDLILDYVWRSPQDPAEAKLFRQKLIIKPPNVQHVMVHWIKHSRPTIYLSASIARLNHYRIPWRGPYRGGPPKTWVMDTQLQTKYRDGLLMALNQSHVGR